MQAPKQSPSPGTRRIDFRGDVLRFELVLPEPRPGRAFLRTNAGRARLRYREVVQHVETNAPVLNADWHDLEMQEHEPGHYRLDLPLTDCGFFRAKALFLPETGPPEWPPGDDVCIKVQPAHTCAGNTIYTAFVRQFGPNRYCDPVETGHNEPIDRLEEGGYTVIPRSGTFRELIEELDFIIGDLGFRIVQLLPVFPVPTTYARMGRFGSPFAALDFMDVDPALAVFDRRTTPLDQFRELTAAVHQRRGLLFLDIPVNHTGWASWLQNHHPEWFQRHHDETFRSPGAWGVVWADLSELDYAHRGLWQYVADVFLFWCRQGVDGFRCDAGYMIPHPVWEYITARVRTEFPDTVFLLEGLGGKIETTRALVTSGGLDWAYSEIFQNESRQQLEQYLPAADELSRRYGTLVSFAETHDNLRLAARGDRFARMRVALVALCSRCGAFGVTNGVEWLAREKLDVHEARPLNWGAEDNLVALLRRLTRLLGSHPAFEPGAGLQLVHHGPGNVLAVLRSDRGRANPLLVAANLDCESPATVHWRADAFPGKPAALDLLSGDTIDLACTDAEVRCPLEPGAVVCLTRDKKVLARLEAAEREFGLPLGAPDRQRLRAEALRLRRDLGAGECAAELGVDQLTALLAADPEAFLAEQGEANSFVTPWDWPFDARREVPVPFGSPLLIRAEHRFSARVYLRTRVLWAGESLPDRAGRHFAALGQLPPEIAREGAVGELELHVFGPDGPVCSRSAVRFLGDYDRTHVQYDFGAAQIPSAGLHALLTNGTGAMGLVRARWAELESGYDCLLGANLHATVPVDRHIMFTRCRAWLVHRGYSAYIGPECQTAFRLTEAGPQWEFRVPCGMGSSIPLTILAHLEAERNRLLLRFHRAHDDSPGALTTEEPVCIVVRPDVEDRCCHALTKAFTGPEQAFPASIRGSERGFEFGPDPARRLHAAADAGTFVVEPEWQYMVERPVEATRGLESTSDLFSPGYFRFEIAAGDTVGIQASVAEPPSEPADTPDSLPPAAALPQLHADAAAARAVHAFVVRRDHRKTVIAGYPWFLDWGRDTLICLRGMIAAGMLEEARDILREFARFEQAGTIPNMIRGEDDSDRDTSDAPLWLLVACNDLLRKEENDDFLEADCGGRPLHEVLLSVGHHYVSGTPNGIRVDHDSGLVYSPSHFTWMDTNFPAGTPRRGYPIEIQALWHAGLRLLDHVAPGEGWGRYAEQVRQSLLTLYPVPGRADLADCIHAAPGVPAAEGRTDDHLRPNQLFAITLGAVVDPQRARGILAACRQLLVPGAIRSLADRPVTHELPIRGPNALLNDPRNPYWGRYEGDEDTRRKPAYHNGTAWTWPFPAFAEALVAVHGAAARRTALSLLGSAVCLLNSGCVGQCPEVLDGDAPHAQRGCGAQAWGATELLRVIRYIKTV